MEQNIPSEILEILRCSKCKQYLSRSPVYLELDGSSVCSRCFEPTRPAIRNLVYETIASLSHFPCKYQDLGCKKTVPFSKEKELIPHEQNCMFHPYVCPLVASTRCDWLGNRQRMLDHCRAKHPGKVLTNPANMTLDITRSSENDFIVSACGNMFLLQLKVCISSGKIYVATRCLEDFEEAKFFFTLDIKRGSCVISRSGAIQKLNDPPTKESSCVVVNINSLLDLFCGFDGTSFIITIKQNDETLDPKNPGKKINPGRISRKQSRSSTVSSRDALKVFPKGFPLRNCKMGSVQSGLHCNEIRVISDRVGSQGKSRVSSARSEKARYN